MTRILLLCTGNSCRSQMAEGWLRDIVGERIEQVEIYSAGIRPERINPRTIQVMAEEGIDITGHTSNHVEEYRNVDFDYVITLCENARKECTAFSTHAKKIHHPLPDPADATGNEDEIIKTYRSVRSLIRTAMQEFTAKELTQHLLRE